MLPAIGGLPSVDMALPLLISLAIVLRFPIGGGIVHTVLLALSFAMDQTRLQPEVVSMGVLFFATSGRRSLLYIGRAHLLTLWFWAGFSKLISPHFYTDTGPWMFDGLPVPSLFDPVGRHFGAVVILLEMGAGLLGLFVRTRRIGVAFAIAVHLGALASIGPLGHNWNSVIWPWNVALAVAALTLIAPWTQSVKAFFVRSKWPLRLAVAFVALYPAGYYIGAVDAYLSHHLYSSDTPSAQVCDEDGECFADLVLGTLEDLNVPLPPEHRLFRAQFDGSCSPGDELRITDERRRYASRDWETRRSCPAGN